jgi:hypothetical protein
MPRIIVPDHDDIEVEQRLTVSEARRLCESFGVTQVVGATGTQDEEGNITFARQTGGAKAV